MTCVVCKKGQTVPGSTTVVLERGEMTLVVKAVPARVCEVCGEAYVEEAAAAQLLQQVEAAAGSGVQLEVRAYIAA